MTVETASKLRIAYYEIHALLYARKFHFEPDFNNLNRNYFAIVELDSVRRHGPNRFVQRFS